MQRCLKCGRTYESDTQKFCTHDGGRLETELPSASSQAPTTYDLNQTVRTGPFDPEETVTRMPDLNRTVASAPTSEIRSKETGPATPPPSAPIYSQPPTPQPPPQPPPVQPEQPQTVAFNQSQPPPPAPQPPQQYYQPPPAPQAPPQHAAPPVPQPPVQPPPMQQPMQPQQYAPAAPQHQQPVAPAPAKARKSSKAPLIIGLVVILLIGAAAAWYFLIYKKQNATTSANTNDSGANVSANANANVGANENANTTANANTNTNTNTAEPPPPPNSTKFVNSKANLDGKLAENYSDLSFYYPNGWELDPKSGVAGASNFVRVERMLPPNFTQENFTVSWYKSKGTFEADNEGLFEQAVELAKSKFANAYPEFKVVSEGETTVNGIKGHEFRFQSVSKGTAKGDLTLWGRVIYLPPGKEGETNGLQLLMLTTSLAPEITSAADVGVKGELPMILNSFRMGSK